MADPVKRGETTPERGPARGLVRSTGLISGLIFLSRLLGVVRETVFAALLGAGVYADAFQAAFRKARCRPRSSRPTRARWPKEDPIAPTGSAAG